MTYGHKLYRCRFRRGRSPRSWATREPHAVWSAFIRRPTTAREVRRNATAWDAPAPQATGGGWMPNDGDAVRGTKSDETPLSCFDLLAYQAFTEARDA